MFWLKTVKYTRLKHKQADFAFGGEDGVRRGNHYQNSVILYNLISGSGSLQKLSGVTFSFLFPHDSVLEGCIFLGIYPLLWGCLICWEYWGWNFWWDCSPSYQPQRHPFLIWYEGAVQLFFRGNCFICSYRFGVSMVRGEFRIFKVDILEPHSRNVNS